MSARPPYRNGGRSAEAGSAGDGDLVAGVLKGDTGAFERLFVKYRQGVFAAAFRILRHEDAALDVVQETFIKAYESLGSLKEGERLFPWLRRIAVNLAIDALRRRRRAGEMSLEEDIGDGEDTAGKVAVPPDGAAGPASEAADSEFAAALWEALGELPESQRTVFMLHAVENMTYREVAQAMNCSIGTVMSRLHYARKKLQELLKPHIVGRIEGQCRYRPG